MSHILAAGSTLIGRYRVDEYLAQGGMQEVYVCSDLSLNRQVVVKTPKGGVADKRFRRGAEMGARVNHHSVAATFDYYEDDDFTFLVEEFVDGRDLGKRLNDDFYFLDPSLAAHVVHNIARALYEAHRVGICHRDLKPSNVMTSNDPALSVVKLTDFGIAKLAEREIAAEMEMFDKDASTLTSSNTLLGAVPYMAPECWSNWRDAGQPMDVWALGCIAYQLATGEPPFGYGRNAIANAIRAEQTGQVELEKPWPFGRHTPTASLEDSLWALIQECTRVDPSQRPTAANVMQRCGTMMYSLAPRQVGTIAEYGFRYPSGSRAQSGTIADSVLPEAYHFHRSDYFGAQPPIEGKKVSYSVYPGAPRKRASPVLVVK